MRLATIAMALGLAAVAHAQKLPPTIQPPQGWHADRAAADRMLPSKKLPVTGTPATTWFEAWKPDRPGAVLYVTVANAEASAAQRDAIASAELGELAEAMRRQGAAVKAEASSQSANIAARQLEAAVRWRDDKAGLVTSSRLVIAAGATDLQIAKAECILALDVEPALATACEQALATLTSDLAREARVELAIVAAPAAAAIEAAPGRSAVEPPRLDDGSKVALPPMPVAAPPRDTDRRPIYVGGALVVMAAIFYWNRRRRERFEREDAQAAAGPEPQVAPSGDDDADDLHAAAAEPESKEKS